MAGEPTADSAAPLEELEPLMRRYQNADGDAAAALISRLSPQIFHFFLGQVRDRSHAEDLLQDFWLRIHNARATYRPAEPLLPWIYAIARRVQVDDYRRRSKIKRHELQAEKLPESPTKSNGHTATFEMADVLKVLPQAQRGNGFAAQSGRSEPG